MAASTPSSPHPKHGRRVVRWSLWLLGGLLLLVLLIVGSLWAAVHTERGSRLLWQLAERWAPVTLSGEWVGGTFADGMQLRDLRYADASRRLQLDRMRARWHVDLSSRAITIQTLQLGQVDLTQLPTPPEPRRLPADLRLPVALELRDFSLDKLRLHQEDSVTEVSNIRLSAHSNGVRHALRLLHAQTPVGRVEARLQLDGRRPFPLDGKAHLQGAWQNEGFTIDAGLAGSLEALNVEVRASGDRLQGTAEIAATPFGTLPFTRARIDLEHLNPQLFNPSAPRADLRLLAQLAPVETAAPAEPTASASKPTQTTPALTVAGPVSLHNDAPGALDQQHLPLVGLQAQLRLDAKRQELQALQAELVGGGRLSGKGHLTTEDGSSQGMLDLQAEQLNLHALHGRLPITQLQGPLTAQLDSDGEQSTQQFALQLADATLSLKLKADLDPKELRVHQAELGLGEDHGQGRGRLSLQGRWQRQPASTFLVEGQFIDFNPGLLLAALPPAPSKSTSTKLTSTKSGPSTPAARKSSARATASTASTPAANKIQANINADFIAEGELQPTLGVRLGFDVRKSTYDNLPMTGSGRIRITDQRLAASNVQLAVAGNQLQAEGSFGAPRDRLRFSIDAPALERLGFGLAGLLQTRGTLGGSLERPQIDASYRASQLVLGPYRLAALDGQAQTRGLPGADPQARVVLQLDAQGLEAPQLSLAALKAAIDGTYARHSISLQARGKLREQPLALSMSAQGRLRELPARGKMPAALAWDGTLNTLKNEGFPALALDKPVELAIAPGNLQLGAATLTLEQSVLTLQGLRLQEGRLRTTGSLKNLDLGHVLALQRKLTGEPSPLRTDLVLDGAWDVDWSTKAQGFVRLERRSGDLTLRDGSRAAEIGLRALRLEAQLRGERIDIEGRIDASRVGEAGLTAQIGLSRTNVQGNSLVQLSPDASLTGRVTARLPRLQNLTALAGPRIVLEGNAAMDIALGGTLGAPLFSGSATADDMALTLYDQGVRLRDGTARLRLDNNVVELQEVLFHGGDGTLRATGRLPLDRSDPSLSATVVADRLQFLASPTGRLTLSGKAVAANVNDQLQVDGQFIVDRARFTRPAQSAPSLDDDVVVIRGKERIPPGQQPPAARAGGPLAARINIDVDLGSDFRFEGAGAELRLAGKVTARSAPGEDLQAIGTIRVPEGNYEAFGTKLVIERGRLNFQGPPTNPALNILAMRPPSPKEEVRAGVLITGTARRPRVELVSEPSVPEEEKLSWLVFGRGSSNANTGQTQNAAQAAALGLLNSVGGNRIAKNIGLDQLSIGSSDFGLANQQVVNLGKEISDRLTLGFEQSLAGSASVVKLTYELSRYWSVVARGGTISGLDVQYSRRFDFPRQSSVETESGR